MSLTGSSTWSLCSFAHRGIHEVADCPPSPKRVVEAVGAWDLAEEGAAAADCPYDDDDEVEAAVEEAVALAALAPERA